METARAAFEWLAKNANLVADRLRARDSLERIAWKKESSSMSLPSRTSGGTTTCHDRSQVPTGQ
jgi:hypothetical protein